MEMRLSKMIDFTFQIDERKLEGYCLNPRHPVGKHKACVFASALGLGESDALVLKQLILEGIQNVRWSKENSDRHGQRYVCDISCKHEDKFATIRCAWINHTGSKTLRLTTCYVKKL